MIISVCNRVENIVGKGEIARYEQFLLSPQCFQKAFYPEASKGVIVWEWVNYNKKDLPNLDFLNDRQTDRQTDKEQSHFLC